MTPANRRLLDKLPRKLGLGEEGAAPAPLPLSGPSADAPLRLIEKLFGELRLDDGEVLDTPRSPQWAPFPCLDTPLADQRRAPGMDPPLPSPLTPH